MSSCYHLNQHIIPLIKSVFRGRQDDTFIWQYDVSLHKTTRRHFYLPPHIIPVNNLPITPGVFKKSPVPRIFERSILLPIPLHGVGCPRDDGDPTPELESLENRCTHEGDLRVGSNAPLPSSKKFYINFDRDLLIDEYTH